VAFAVVLPTLTPISGTPPPTGTPLPMPTAIAGCPGGVQVCNLAWVYTTQTGRWQASHPAFNPSTRLDLPLVLKGP